MRRGFTLIEMLILLALTSLLMSILLPTLSFGRKRAVGLECKSNLRELGELHNIEKGFMNGNWGTSAYDLSDGGEVAGEGGGNGDPRKKPGNFGTEEDPTRAQDAKRDSIRSDSGSPFDEMLEDQAINQPSAWTLVCPVGFAEGLNSFGITDYARLKRFDLVDRSNDMIFGCSDHKVTISVRSFAFRHLNRVNIYFGDSHVKEFSPNEFPDELANQLSR